MSLARFDLGAWDPDDLNYCLIDKNLIDAEEFNVKGGAKDKSYLQGSAFTKSIIYFTKCFNSSPTSSADLKVLIDSVFATEPLHSTSNHDEVAENNVCTCCNLAADNFLKLLLTRFDSALRYVLIKIHETISEDNDEEKEEVSQKSNFSPEVFATIIQRIFTRFFTMEKVTQYFNYQTNEEDGDKLSNICSRFMDNLIHLLEISTHSAQFISSILLSQILSKKVFQKINISWLLSTSERILPYAILYSSSKLNDEEKQKDCLDLIDKILEIPQHVPGCNKLSFWNKWALSVLNFGNSFVFKTYLDIFINQMTYQTNCETLLSSAYAFVALFKNFKNYEEEFLLHKLMEKMDEHVQLSENLSTQKYYILVLCILVNLSTRFSSVPSTEHGNEPDHLKELKLFKSIIDGGEFLCLVSFYFSIPESELVSELTKLETKAKKEEEISVFLRETIRNLRRSGHVPNSITQIHHNLTEHLHDVQEGDVEILKLNTILNLCVLLKNGANVSPPHLKGIGSALLEQNNKSCKPYVIQSLFELSSKCPILMSDLFSSSLFDSKSPHLLNIISEKLRGVLDLCKEHISLIYCPTCYFEKYRKIQRETGIVEDKYWHEYSLPLLQNIVEKKKVKHCGLHGGDGGMSIEEFRHKMGLKEISSQETPTITCGKTRRFISKRPPPQLVACGGGVEDFLVLLLHSLLHRTYSTLNATNSILNENERRSMGRGLGVLGILLSLTRVEWNVAASAQLQGKLVDLLRVVVECDDDDLRENGWLLALSFLSNPSFASLVSNDSSKRTLRDILDLVSSHGKIGEERSLKIKCYVSDIKQICNTLSTIRLL